MLCAAYSQRKAYCKYKEKLLLCVVFLFLQELVPRRLLQWESNVI